MNSPGRIWRQVGRQSIWGRRGLLKANAAWLPLSVFLLTDSARIDPQRTLWLIPIFLCVMSWILVSILANDLSDRQTDRASGKERWISSLPMAGAIAILMILLAGSLGLILTFRSPVAVRWVYTGAVLTGLSYSLRPFHFKGWGVWGILVYSLSCALAYAAIPGVWMKAGPVALGLAGAVVFLDKWVNLLFHQIIDHEADSKGKIRTYAVRAGLDSARRILCGMEGLASLGMLAVLAYIAVHSGEWRVVILSVVGVSFAAAAAFAGLASKRSKMRTALVSELSWVYLGLTFAVFRVLPLVLLWTLALESKALWWALGAALVMLAAESWQSLRYRYE